MIKYLAVVLLFGATLVGVFPFGTPKHIALPDRRHCTCVNTPSSLDYDLSFQKNGIIFRCQDLTKTGPTQDTKLENLAVSESLKNAGSTMLVTCVPLITTPDAVKYSSSRGYILASDFQRNKKYVCHDITKNGGRVARGFKNPIDWALDTTDHIVSRAKSTLIDVNVKQQEFLEVFK